MSREIHIFIHDDSPADRRRGDVSVTRAGFTDPGQETSLSPPDDPGRETTLSPPDDPRGASRTVPFALGPACPPQPCGCGRAQAERSPRPELRPRDYSGFVIVRTAAGVDVASYASLHDLARGLGLDALLAALEVGGDGEDGGRGDGDDGDDVVAPDGSPASRRLVSRPLIEARGCRGREATVQAILDLEKAAARTRLRPRHSLSRYWRLDARAHPERVGELVDELNALPEVDLAYRELAALDPAFPDPAADAEPGTTFFEDQGYLDDAPLGIGARWAWARLAGRCETPSPVTVCDLEQRWHPAHRDLPAEIGDELYFGANRDAAGEEDGPGHHGTAVLGQLAASSRYGVTGGARPVGRFALSSHYLSRGAREGGRPHPFAGTNGHVAAAIFHALLDPDPPTELAALAAGDVLLLEVQRALLPTEVDAADFDAIRLACALGVVVVEAAGNGGHDLDRYVDPDTGLSLRRGDPRFRDSGAILVGAARSSLPHDRAGFSNHGSRVDCFAWGDSVTSCGYGDLAGDALDDYYTNTFAGTSSAAPIIAAAAALVQALHPERTGNAGGRTGSVRGRLGSLEMRALLADPATGTPQGPNVPGAIGVMPDLRAVVGDALQLVPDVYLRHHPCDGGASDDAPAGSSPAVVALATGSSADLGEGPASNDPAPGVQVLPGGGVYALHVRLRNRGLGTDEASVKLFASPAATLIAPDWWQRVDGGELRGEVHQGDLLTVLGPVAWSPPAVPPEESLPGGPVPYSFLAVLCPSREEGSGKTYPPVRPRGDILPPGGAWFDWDGYRAFLRRSGVAWRNAYPVGVPDSGVAGLPFFVAGTPDRARRFDFELIQRLPKGARVELEVPRGLGAKLLQAQPLLAGAAPKDGRQRLFLPARPRTGLPRVKLAPGVCARARLEVADDALSSGHGLVLRQLWRGREVGRIGWWFR